MKEKHGQIKYLQEIIQMQPPFKSNKREPAMSCIGPMLRSKEETSQRKSWIRFSSARKG